MNDEKPSKPPTGKRWFEKLSQAFSDEPESLQDIMDILRDAEERDVLDTDSLGIIEGAVQVTDMQVREVMIPRSQMTTVRSNQTPEEYIGDIIESAHSRFPLTFKHAIWSLRSRTLFDIVCTRRKASDGSL